MAYGQRSQLNDQREQRLNYFLQHYLPKQDVLYRLPLDIPINSFWQELVERRKAEAVLLPLHNALGKPYWYVLTPTMVKASERLAEEAGDQVRPDFGTLYTCTEINT